MDLTQNLKAFLENGEDWERKGTSLGGVSILKLPGTKTRQASLAIEINPLNEKGVPMKKKGIIIMGSNELRAFREIFNNEKTDTLISAVEEIIPGRKKVMGKDEDVLQI
ncbi:MAG TPA: hypothetical protein VMW63_02235 [Methanoregulaceae archaeon]|nr:hypothetical protein [Methanoregulaceae archaeon]